jgi:N-methylhydantoinase A
MRPMNNQTDARWHRPFGDAARPLVRRYLRRGIHERILATGEVLIGLDESQARGELEVLKRCGIQGLAICLINSFVNPAHEQRLLVLAGEVFGPKFPVSASFQVGPRAKEYPRASTTVIDVMMKLIYDDYAHLLDAQLRASGFTGQLNFADCTAALIPWREAITAPHRILFAGPAAGTAACCGLGAAIGDGNLIGCDVGGTSTDVTVIVAGAPFINDSFEIEHDLLVNTLATEVASVGAGGGSIVSVSPSGDLRVGPHSAGATPGPACYGQGGRQPTVTDANLVLGYLNPKGLLGGRLPLDLEKARDAIKSIADPLGISVERAAYGMFTIVNSNMVNGIRRVSVERGYDPRDFVLVGAGGATAAHITALAGEMGIDTVILPKLASGLCAFGQIISDVKYNYMATSPLRLEGKAYATINELFDQIETQGVKHLIADGFAKSAIRIERSLDMRYVGQVHECTVEIGTYANDAKALEKVKDAFHKRHEELYTYSEPHNAVEVVNIESTLYGHVEKPQPPRVKKGAPPAKAIVGRRKAIFAADGKLVNTPIYDGSRLGAGATIKGPAIIEEVTTTIVIEPRWTARLDVSGSYVLTRK